MWSSNAQNIVSWDLGRLLVVQNLMRFLDTCFVIYSIISFTLIDDAINNGTRVKNMHEILYNKETITGFEYCFCAKNLLLRANNRVHHRNEKWMNSNFVIPRSFAVQIRRVNEDEINENTLSLLLFKFGIIFFLIFTTSFRRDYFCFLQHLLFITSLLLSTFK